MFMIMNLLLICTSWMRANIIIRTSVSVNNMQEMTLKNEYILYR